MTGEEESAAGEMGRRADGNKREPAGRKNRPAGLRLESRPLLPETYRRWSGTTARAAVGALEVAGLGENRGPVTGVERGLDFRNDPRNGLAGSARIEQRRYRLREELDFCGAEVIPGRPAESPVERQTA